MPLTLHQLKVIRYRPPPGQTQTQAIQQILQMYREADYWNITPEQLCKVILLNAVQTNDLMVTVQERLDEKDDWEVVRNHIITLDRASAMSKDFLNNPGGRRESGALAQVNRKTQCMACGRKGHKQSDCKVDKNKLQCTYCKSTKSHMTKVCQKKKKYKTNKDPDKDKPPKDEKP